MLKGCGFQLEYVAGIRHQPSSKIWRQVPRPVQRIKSKMSGIIVAGFSNGGVVHDWEDKAGKRVSCHAALAVALVSGVLTGVKLHVAGWWLVVGC